MVSNKLVLCNCYKKYNTNHNNYIYYNYNGDSNRESKQFLKFFFPVFSKIFYLSKAYAKNLHEKQTKFTMPLLVCCKRLNLCLFLVYTVGHIVATTTTVLTTKTLGTKSISYYFLKVSLLNPINPRVSPLKNKLQ